MHIGQIVREYRREKGVTLTGLAEKLEISPSYLSAIERNIRRPSSQMLRNISDKLNIPVFFLTGSEEDIITGKKLKAMRESKGLNIEDLSEICDIPARLLAKFEEGSINPDSDCLEKLSAGLNVSIKYFQDKVDNNGLGTRLRKIRTDSYITIAALAEKAGVSPGLISQIENGQTMPHLETLARIAGALNTSSANLLIEGRDVEDLMASFSSDMIDVLGDPNVQAVLRSLRGLETNEKRYIINYIQFYKQHNPLIK